MALKIYQVGSRVRELQGSKPSLQTLHYLLADLAKPCPPERQTR
jgi:hypothetical protein